MKKVQLTVTRMQIIMGLGVVQSIKAPQAFLLGKVVTYVTQFLEKFPEGKFRLTVEAIDETTEDHHGDQTKAA